MADESAGVVQLIRMVLAEQDAKRVEQEMQDALKKGSDPKKATDNVEKVDGAIERLGKTIRRVAEFMIARALIRGIIDFGKAAVAAALESRKEWGLLDNALQSAGANVAKMRKEAELTADRFKQAGIAGDEEFARSLRTLVQVSGDAEKSLANMGVVADLAAARNISLEESAGLVAKAMNGQVTMLQRLGIEIPKGSDAVQVLAERFKGAANAIDPAVREQKRLAEIWDDFKEAVGEAILQVGEGGSVVSSMSNVILKMTGIIKDNKAAITEMGGTLLWLGRFVIGDVVMRAYEGWAEIISVVADAMASFRALRFGEGDDWVQSLRRTSAEAAKAAVDVAALRGAIKDINKDDPLSKDPALAKALGLKPEKTGGVTDLPNTPPGGSVKGAGGTEAADAEAKAHIQLLAQQLDLDDKHAEALKELNALQAQYQAIVNDSNKSDEDRVKALAHVKEIEDAINGNFQDRLDIAQTSLEFDDTRLEGISALIDLEAELQAKLDSGNLSMKDRATAMKNMKDVQDALMDGLKGMAKQAGVSEEALKSLWEGNWRAALKSIAKDALWSAGWNIAKAIEMAARSAGAAASGNFAGAAKASAAAKGHLLAAAKFGALAGGAAAASSAGGGDNGGGSSSNGPTGIGSDAANKVQAPGVVVTVYVDGVDPYNPQHQALNQQLNTQVKERYGENSSITIIPRSRGNG